MPTILYRQFETLDRSGRRTAVQSANKSFYELFKVLRMKRGGLFLISATGPMGYAGVTALVGEVLPQKSVVRDFRVEHNSGSRAEKCARCP